MIHVLARVTLKKNCVPLFLRTFRELATLVRKEPGCLDYYPAQDLDLHTPHQEYDPNTVTIIEKWAHEQDLARHLRSGHMRSFHEQTKDLVLDLRLTITKEV